MLADGLKLSVYLGERDRAGGRLLAQELMEGFAEAGCAPRRLLRRRRGASASGTGCRPSGC